MIKRKLPTQIVLELSCSAHRTLGRYIKEGDIWFNQLNPRETPKEIPNKWLIQSTLGLKVWEHENRLPPKHLIITNEDLELAENIKKFYRRLTFDIIAEGESDAFRANIFKIFNSDEITESEIGYIACLPSIYFREKSKDKVKKASMFCDHEYLGIEGSKLFDLDSEILEVNRSRNFDAYNVTAIINNKMATWMSTPELEIGPAVIVRANIKGLNTHQVYNVPVTRLNYVKAAQ